MRWYAVEIEISPPLAFNAVLYARISLRSRTHPRTMLRAILKKRARKSSLPQTCQLQKVLSSTSIVLCTNHQSRQGSRGSATPSIDRVRKVDACGNTGPSHRPPDTFVYIESTDYTTCQCFHIKGNIQNSGKSRYFPGNFRYSSEDPHFMSNPLPKHPHLERTS